MLKVAIVVSLIAVISGSYQRDEWGGNSGDDYSHPIPYAFGYDVKDDHGMQQSREEKGDGHGSVRGSYGYRDDKGIERRVEYVDDKGGFRAVVKTNEPGTAKSNPADVEMLADPIIVEWSKWQGRQDNRQDNRHQLW